MGRYGPPEPIAVDGLLLRQIRPDVQLLATPREFIYNRRSIPFVFDPYMWDNIYDDINRPFADHYRRPTPWYGNEPAFPCHLVSMAEVARCMGAETVSVTACQDTWTVRATRNFITSCTEAQWHEGQGLADINMPTRQLMLQATLLYPRKEVSTYIHKNHIIIHVFTDDLEIRYLALDPTAKYPLQ